MGVSTNLLAGVLFAGVVAASLQGCKPEQAYGYLQVTREIPVAENDRYMLNDEQLTGIGERREMVFKHKAGHARLVLLRGSTTWTLCTFDLRKDRVVSATLTAERGKIRCRVQG